MSSDADSEVSAGDGGPPTADDASEASDDSAANTPSLPPELLLDVMRILARQHLKGTLLEFAAASRSCCALAVPELYRHVNLLADSPASARWLANFAEDGLGMDKWTNVRSVRAFVGIRTGEETGARVRRSARSFKRSDAEANAIKCRILGDCRETVRTMALSLAGAEGQDVWNELPLFPSLKHLDLTVGRTTLPAGPIPGLPPSLELFTLRNYTDVQGADFSPLLGALDAHPSLQEWSLAADVDPCHLAAFPRLMPKLARVAKVHRESTALALLSDPAFAPRVLVFRRSYASSPAGWKKVWELVKKLESLEYFQFPLHQQLDAGIPLSSGLPPNLKRLVVESVGVKPEPKRLARNLKDLRSSLARTRAGPGLAVLVGKDVGEFSPPERALWKGLGEGVELCAPGDERMARVGLEEGWRALDECCVAW
ncbi:hypothetical protein DFJ74DRAFT_707390 [Hyaloraphidium curvatum]|nr:hypothetical protein DFJ74DRAFT_707390 [Hyaloraphidium curvatum]